MQNRYFAYFSDVSHIGVDFRILICEFAYAWRPCKKIDAHHKFKCYHLVRSLDKSRVRIIDPGFRIWISEVWIIEGLLCNKNTMCYFNCHYRLIMGNKVVCIIWNGHLYFKV